MAKILITGTAGVGKTAFVAGLVLVMEQNMGRIVARFDPDAHPNNLEALTQWIEENEHLSDDLVAEVCSQSLRTPAPVEEIKRRGGLLNMFDRVYRIEVVK